MRDLRDYRHRSPSDQQFPLSVRELTPILSEFDEQAGVAYGQYFHQDLWAARRIFARRPERHVDVGSRIDGFIAHLLVFMPVEVVDIRPLNSPVSGLSFVRDDARMLSGLASGSVPSLSSLHAVEHFGLGRYGDPIDPEGWRKGIHSLSRVLAPGGRLYFSVPVGVQRLEFNAQRIFSPRTVVEAFSDLELIAFAAIDGQGALVEPAELKEYENAGRACGLFEFHKPPRPECPAI